ncbi:MAG: hypothetical protein JXN64_15570 [Spirochaetes bacterium]|nr:hypothetical protein [Spirochaetota bacterium]
MDNIMRYIQQNPVIAVCAAAVLIFVAGFIIRRLRIISLVFIIIAAFAFYVILKDDKIGKVKIEEIKKDVKSEVMKKIK